MTDNKNSCSPDYREKRRMRGGGVSSGTYGLAFIGALVYYFQHAATFGAGLLGFIKALVWPAMLIYNIMEYLKM